MKLVLVGVVLTWLAVGVVCWLVYQLMRQNGRLLVRIEALEQRLGQVGMAPEPDRPRGLPVGSNAPAFELPDLDGGRVALEQFRGRRVLLIFFDPGCGFCRQMAPHLAALPADGGDGRPVPLVVTAGDAGESRKLVEQHGLRCPVLIQREMEVARLYQATGTPMGYLIDEQGAIASELAIGTQALLALAARATTTAGGVGGDGHRAYRGNRSLADSRLNRNGLPAGTPAPGFRLPRLDGGTLSLESYRGRRVLLVFSDPECGPCDRLAPQLEQLHRRARDVQVLMIGRGDPTANRAKVAEHGLTFPVALQRHWEISRDYGKFATPIGYLIDERGVISADVAGGAEAILALVSGGAAPTDREEAMPMR